MMSVCVGVCVCVCVCVYLCVYVYREHVYIYDYWNYNNLCLSVLLVCDGGCMGELNVSRALMAAKV